ncbi:programmed cell death protein 2-like [Teleopsis dalmanni]|uniref:programmed cell death protein 2-like n=1 Tax=Teleopsis dalmanni TaxID=139649 RepID=UPI000D32B211|nr:programmed cell death protein 2-like [Teleopsis dalmanni]
MSDMDLGFPEQCEPGWLTNRYFPSKVGGKPAWLELDLLPSKEEMFCDECKTPKTFLCQIYAPFGDEHNFHRTIFVFVCRTATCQKANTASNLMVLRSQLAKKNKFYSEIPPDEDADVLPAIMPNKKLCIVCGCLGQLQCSRCKNANYCAAEHQRAHWPHHKTICSAANVTENEVNKINAIAFPKLLFPEYEITIEPCDENNRVDLDKDDEAKEKEQMAEYEKLAAEGKTGALNNVPDGELEKYAGGTSTGMDDKYFRKFKKTMWKQEAQILRYKRNGEPLWISNPEKTIAAHLVIPNCELCGGPRQFEFQIMPQMLYIFNNEAIDWGVLAVYTCVNSCKIPEDIGYVKEYIIKQDVVDDKK